MAKGSKAIGTFFLVTLALGLTPSESTLRLLVPDAAAAGGKVESPTGVAPDRYTYYPGTEALERDEIRIVACGTGMPAARHGQPDCPFLPRPVAPVLRRLRSDRRGSGRDRAARA